MTRSLRVWLAVIALLTGAVLLACSGGDNGDDNGDGNGDSEQPTATLEVADPDGDGTGNGDVGPSGDTLDDVPLPSGAKETASGSFSSTEIPFFVPDQDFDAGAYTSIDFTQYEVDDSPDTVIAFYKDKLGSWDEVFVFSSDSDGEETGFGVWTRDDDRRVVWVAASTVDGVTELMVIVGSLD